MASSSITERVHRSIASREDAFRHYFSKESQNIAREISVSVEPPSPDDAQFYAVSIPDVNRAPCQLHPELIRRFLCEYPLGEVESAGECEPIDLRERWNRNRFPPSDTYSAQEDAAFLLDEIDSGFCLNGQGGSCGRSDAAYSLAVGWREDDGNDPEPDSKERAGDSPDAKSKRRVPSLLSMAQRASRGTVLREMHSLESRFVQNLCKAKARASVAMQNVQQQKQKELETLKKVPSSKKFLYYVVYFARPRTNLSKRLLRYKSQSVLTRCRSKLRTMLNVRQSPQDTFVREMSFTKI